MTEPMDTGHSREALLAGAASQAKHLAEISADLLRQVRMSRWERAYFIGMTLLIAAIGVLLVWLAVSNNTNITETRKSTQLVIDCTTVGHACYDNAQKQTARAVASIVQGNLASTWCSIHSKTYADAQKCVIVLIGHH